MPAPAGAGPNPPCNTQHSVTLHSERGRRVRPRVKKSHVWKKKTTLYLVPVYLFAYNTTTLWWKCISLSRSSCVVESPPKRVLRKQVFSIEGLFIHRFPFKMCPVKQRDRDEWKIFKNPFFFLKEVLFTLVGEELANTLYNNRSSW